MFEIQNNEIVINGKQYVRYKDACVLVENFDEIFSNHLINRIKNRSHVYDHNLIKFNTPFRSCISDMILGNKKFYPAKIRVKRTNLTQIYYDFGVDKIYIINVEFSYSKFGHSLVNFDIIVSEEELKKRNLGNFNDSYSLVKSYNIANYIITSMEHDMSITTSNGIYHIIHIQHENQLSSLTSTVMCVSNSEYIKMKLKI